MKKNYKRIHPNKNLLSIRQSHLLGFTALSLLLGLSVFVIQSAKAGALKRGFYFGLDGQAAFIPPEFTGSRNLIGFGGGGNLNFGYQLAFTPGMALQFELAAGAQYTNGFQFKGSKTAATTNLSATATSAPPDDNIIALTNLAGIDHETNDYIFLDDSAGLTPVPPVGTTLRKIICSDPGDPTATPSRPQGTVACQLTATLANNFTINSFTTTSIANINKIELTASRGDILAPVTLGFNYALPFIETTGGVVTIGIAGGVLLHNIDRSYKSSATRITTTTMQDSGYAAGKTLTLTTTANGPDPGPNQVYIQTGTGATGNYVNTDATPATLPLTGTIADETDAKSFTGAKGYTTFATIKDQLPDNAPLIGSPRTTIAEAAVGTPTYFKDTGTFLSILVVPKIQLAYDITPQFFIYGGGKFYVAFKGYSEVYSDDARTKFKEAGVSYKKDQLFWYGTLDLGISYTF